MYKIYVRDGNLKRLGEITDYRSLEMIPRFNSVGSFVLELPMGSDIANYLLMPKSGIRVDKDGETIFSGPVIGRNRKCTKDSDLLILSGKDDNVFLTRRLALPVPSGPPYTTDYDVRTGPAETIMKQYVDVNIGPSARADRILLVVDEDQGLGATVTGRARFDNLLDLLTSLAVTSGLGFRVVQVNNTLEFQVYLPTDKSRSVIFSQSLGNLSGFEYSSEDTTVNAVIVGGNGEGSSRIIYEESNSDSVDVFGRIETFIDQRNTGDLSELSQSAQETLTSNGEKTSLSISPIDTPRLTFFRDYYLGDKVSVTLTNNGLVTDKIKDVIREVNIKITPDGETILPVVGNQESSMNFAAKIFKKIRSAEQRVGKLERR